MLHKSQIIVLHTIKHSDTGVVVRAYSDTHGKTAFYLYAGRKRLSSGLLSPLSIIDIVSYRKHGSDSGMNAPGEERVLPVIREASPACNLLSLRSDIVKGSIAIYMCELLTKVIREVESNTGLYEFLKHSVMLLDTLETGTENFHLHFTANLCRITGYMPNDNYSAEEPYFDFAGGRFVADYDERNCFTPEESLLLHIVLSTPAHEIAGIECNGKLRNTFLQRILDYLSFHSGAKLELKSLAVLRETFE